MKMKRNIFVRKVECWQCFEKFHLGVITKYNGILCKKCYQEKYEEMKTLFFDFIASFEVEYDTDFKEETQKLCDVIETIHAYYGGCCYHLENEDSKEEYKEVVSHAKEIYLELEEFDIKSKSLEENDNEDGKI
ncbi:MAG: hypothetical protein ACTSR5_02605 [Promethearchaeota archaeon]